MTESYEIVLTRDEAFDFYLLLAAGRLAMLAGPPISETHRRALDLGFDVYRQLGSVLISNGEEEES